MQLTLYNSLTRKKEPFEPLNPENVRMYVCGPTVYARPHLGNARSVVVYDVLYRLLRHLYGEAQVTYVRNITDVDDKIITASGERGISINALTHEVTEQFHADMAALGCLTPTHEPKATGHIPEMIAMIEALIANGCAYAAEGHALFDVTAAPEHTADSPPWHYGMLSGRSVGQQAAGARVAVEAYKKHPGDFVLWKPADAADDASCVFDSPWGKGRPGWHIECSAMATKYLGGTFDIHGGGADLKFPHHENEIAQARCSDPSSEFARCWVHNGFLTVNGEKMAKSAGNFITVRDLLDQGVDGEVIRLALLSSKYNEPLNWTDKLVEDASAIRLSLSRIYGSFAAFYEMKELETNHFWMTTELDMDVKAALLNDLNTPKAFSHIYEQIRECRKLEESSSTDDTCIIEFIKLIKSLQIVGITHDAQTAAEFQRSIENDTGENFTQRRMIGDKIFARAAAKAAKNWAEADRIRDELKAEGIILEDRPDGTTIGRKA